MLLAKPKLKQAVGGLLKPDGLQTVDDHNYIDTANTLNEILVHT